MKPIQIFAHTPISVPGELYVKFLQAFKLSNGNIELCIRSADGQVNAIEISTDDAMKLSISLGASKFPYGVVAERAEKADVI